MTSETENFGSQAARLDADALDKRKERYERQTALIFALLIAVLSASGIILFATSERPRGPTEMADCATIVTATARLACFDQLSRRATPEPFKGAPPAELGDKK